MRRFLLLTPLLLASFVSAQEAAVPAGPARVSGGVIGGSHPDQGRASLPAGSQGAGHLGRGGASCDHWQGRLDRKLEAGQRQRDPRSGAAWDAVKQWTYRPYLLNGEPTEVDTTITVNFNLGGPGSTLAPEVPGGSGAVAGNAANQAVPVKIPPFTGPMRVSNGVMTGQIVSRVPPVYPQQAKDDHVSGTVLECTRSLTNKETSRTSA